MAPTLVVVRQPTVLRHGINPDYQNVHHWPFDRRSFNATELGREFRNCTCAQSRVDPRMHAAMHRIQSVPRRPDVAEMEYLIDRHKGRECGCWDDSQVTLVNLLAPSGYGLDLGLPCQRAWVDRVVWERYIQPCYGARDRLPKGWRQTLAHRHKEDMCDCKVSTSAGATELATAPSFDDLAPTG